MSVDGSLALIFGGCCSNVYALEAVLKHETDSGLIITVTQFFLTALFALPSQLERRRNRSPTLFITPSSPKSSTFDQSSGPPPLRAGKWSVKPLQIPFRRITLMSLMFFSVNMLNNWAFAFDISVPMHIILRSFGSVTTLAVGWLCGKRYSKVQVGSVAALTVGVVVSAWADALAKGKNLSLNPTALTNAAQTTAHSTSLLPGLLILFTAQILSAWMGVFAEATYAAHGRHWQQVLFYSHFYGLIFSLLLLPTLSHQFLRLWRGVPVGLPFILDTVPVLSSLPQKLTQGLHEHRPSQAFLLLLLNAATQVVCISGVNRLSAATSAVTVTVVLNIRKLVSFLLSCLIFGNKMDPLMATGAGIVFASGALYGWDSSHRRGPPSNTAGEKSEGLEREQVVRVSENGKAE